MMSVGALVGAGVGDVGALVGASVGDVGIAVGRDVGEGVGYASGRFKSFLQLKGLGSR